MLYKYNIIALIAAVAISRAGHSMSLAADVFAFEFGCEFGFHAIIISVDEVKPSAAPSKSSS